MKNRRVCRCILFSLFFLLVVKYSTCKEKKINEEVVLQPGEWVTNQLEDVTYYDITIKCEPNDCDIYTMKASQYDDLTHNDTEIEDYIKRYEDEDEISFVMVASEHYYVVAMYPLVEENLNTSTNATLKIEPSSFIFALLEFMFISSLFMCCFGFCLFLPLWLGFFFCVGLLCTSHFFFMFPEQILKIGFYLSVECCREMCGRSIRRMYHTLFFWFLRTRERKQEDGNIQYIELEEKI